MGYVRPVRSGFTTLDSTYNTMHNLSTYNYFNINDLFSSCIYFNIYDLYSTYNRDSFNGSGCFRSSSCSCGVYGRSFNGWLRCPFDWFGSGRYSTHCRSFFGRSYHRGFRSKGSS